MFPAWYSVQFPHVQLLWLSDHLVPTISLWLSEHLVPTISLWLSDHLVPTCSAPLTLWSYGPHNQHMTLWSSGPHMFSLCFRAVCDLELGITKDVFKKWEYQIKTQLRFPQLVCLPFCWLWIGCAHIVTPETESKVVLIRRTIGWRQAGEQLM